MNLEVLAPMDPTSSEPRRPSAVGWGEIRSKYWADWTAVLFLLAMLLLSEYDATPYQRFETQADLEMLGYPHSEHNTVPSWAVPIIALVGPLVLIVAFKLVSGRAMSRVEAHNAILGLFTGVLLTAVITNTAKMTVGRLRPDFNSRCWPDGNQAFSNGGFPACTGKEDIIHEGRKSWPSGHTSWSASGLGYLTWWLFAKLRVFDGNGHSSRLLIGIGPLLVATYIGLTRVKDYWHHPTDVLTGWLLGLVISYLAFRQHYPCFLSREPDRPHVHRLKDDARMLDMMPHRAMSCESQAAGDAEQSDTRGWGAP